MKIYPTGTTDYSQGLIDSGKKGAHILFLWMDMPEKQASSASGAHEAQIPAYGIYECC